MTLDLFLQAIQSKPDGMTMSEILLIYPNVTRRTAQRWVNQGVEQGLVTPLREGRHIRYVPTQADTTQSTLANIPLSTDSQDIVEYINRPLSARTPVAYQHDFLDVYQPNRSYYLSKSLRQQLYNMGQTDQKNRPAGTYGRAVLNRLLIDLSWASSHLEGNTYSRLDTRALIERGDVSTGKALTETQMILNHKAAIEWLVENAGNTGFDRYTLLNLHSLLSENLLPNPADEGRLREHVVEISHSVFRPLDVPQQISATFDTVLNKASLIDDPFEQAFFVMVHIPYLQPFADVNKRVSRLAANLPLLKHNLCPLTFLGVSEPLYTQAVLGVYEMTRVELLRDMFVWAYERSTQEYLAIKQNLVAPDPLRLKYRDTLKAVVREVVLRGEKDTVGQIRTLVAAQVSEADRDEVQALVIDELRRLHEGVLARYGLRPSEWVAWKESNA